MPNRLVQHIQNLQHSWYESVRYITTFTRGRKHYNIYFLRQHAQDREGVIQFRKTGGIIISFIFRTVNCEQTLDALQQLASDFLTRDTTWDEMTSDQIKQRSKLHVRIFLRLLGRKILYISQPLCAIPHEQYPTLHEHSIYLAKTAGWLRNSYCLCSVYRRKDSRKNSIGFDIFRLNRKALISLHDAIKNRQEQTA